MFLSTGTIAQELLIIIEFTQMIKMEFLFKKEFRTQISLICKNNGKHFGFFFSWKPQIDSTPKIEWPFLSLLPPIQKMHRNPDAQITHFACITCRNELLKYWNEPNCPICVTPIYTISNCHYFQCNFRQEIKCYPIATDTS